MRASAGVELARAAGVVLGRWTRGLSIPATRRRLRLQNVNCALSGLPQSVLKRKLG
jgi:hypothetical protein